MNREPLTVNLKSKDFTLIELLVARHPKPWQRKTTLGFTLIELLVVITIIGILATFIVASFTSAQRKSRDARRKSDLDGVKKALEIVKSNCVGGAHYPVMLVAAPEVQYDELVVYLPNTYVAAMKRVPEDPNQTGANDYHYVTSGTTVAATNNGPCPAVTGPPGGAFLQKSGQPSFYIRALLENTSDPQAAASQVKCASSGAPVLAQAYYVCEP